MEKTNNTYLKTWHNRLPRHAKTLLILPIVLAPAFASATAGNSIMFGGFEQSPAIIDTAWDGAGAVTLETNASNCRSGAKCLKMGATTLGVSRMLHPLIIPANSPTVGFWVKRSGTDAGDYLSVDLVAITDANANGSYLDDPQIQKQNIALIYGDDGSATEFKYIFVPIAASLSGQLLWLELTHYNAHQLRFLATFYVDDVVITADDPCTSPAAPGTTGDELYSGVPKINKVRDFLTANYPDFSVGAVAVVKNGSVIATAGTGGANGDTVFHIASTSKFVGSVAAVSLMDDGLLSPDANILTYIPLFTEGSGRQASIMIKHLLQNNSGFPQGFGCSLFACQNEVNGSLGLEQDDLASASVGGRGAALGNLFRPSMLSQHPYSYNDGTNYYNMTAFTPGSSWKYSGWGFMLASRAMEITATLDFPTLMDRRVFNAANMCRTTTNGAEVTSNYAFGTGDALGIGGYCIEPNMPSGHNGDGPSWYPDELDCSARAAAGAVHSSVFDMAKLAKTVLDDLNGLNGADGKIASATGIRKLFCPTGGTGTPGATGSICYGRNTVGGSETAYGSTYGYGNFLKTYSYGGTTYDLYNHGGMRPGFNSYLAIVPEANFAISVLVNKDGAGVHGAHTVAQFAIRCYLHNTCT